MSGEERVALRAEKHGTRRRTKTRSKAKARMFFLVRGMEFSA